jgi:spermidine/putrescine transport system permease protein
MLLTYIPMCGDFITATVLGGAKGNMIGALIDSTVGKGQNWPLGSAIAVMMIVAVLLSLAVATVVVFAGRALLRWRRGVHVPAVAPALAGGGR